MAKYRVWHFRRFSYVGGDGKDEGGGEKGERRKETKIRIRGWVDEDLKMSVDATREQVERMIEICYPNKPWDRGSLRPGRIVTES